MDTSNLLPNELWLRTFSYLGKKDLKSLRLSMEPHFGSLASSRLFTTAYVAARKGVLGTFWSLTTHPIYRTYVKEVVFDSSWIDPTIIAELPDSNTDRAWALFHEQEEIQLNILQACLEEAFQCLSNVRKVSYADLSRISCLPGDNSSDPVLASDYADRSLIERIVSALDYEMSIDCLTNRKDVKCCLHGNECQYRRRFGGLFPLLRVLSNLACSTLQELSLGSIVHACMDEGIPHWFLLPDTNITTFHGFPNIFHGLRKLELSVTVFNLEDSSSSAQLDSRNFSGGALADLLSLAENLEELTLIGDPKATTKLCAARTLGTQEWARLRVVFLRWFEASVGELEAFLRRHTLSLRRLTLDEFNLTSGSWQHIGAIVPVMNPALELIVFFHSGEIWTFRDQVTSGITRSGATRKLNRKPTMNTKIKLKTKSIQRGPNLAATNRILKMTTVIPRRSLSTAATTAAPRQMSREENRTLPYSTRLMQICDPRSRASRMPSAGMSESSRRIRGSR